MTETSTKTPVPPFTLGDELGTGALATVVRVRDAAGHEYAGKIMHASQDLDAAAAERFERESALVHGLDHPNLVRVHGTFDVDGRRVHLMEIVEGPTLAALIAAEAPLPEPRVIALLRGIAEGLDHAHAAGVIHRDLKPANVLVAPGDAAKITDFGMARASSYAGVDRDTFAVVGTPDYMAPESLEPLSVDARSDLYALGCIAFELMTGRPPFAGATPFALLQQHRDAAIPALQDDAPYRPELRGLVRSLLAKAPGDRPQAARAVVTTLDGMGETPQTGLVPAGAGALAPTDADLGRCARCGQVLLPQLPLCLECGMAQTVIEPGDFTMFVTGPGQVGDKLDTKLRSDLLAWIRANPGLRMDASPLEKSIPRLPFVLRTGLSEASARRLAASLGQLGFATECLPGGPSALPALRKKARTIGGRAAMIGAGTMGAFGGMWSNIDSALGVVAVILLYVSLPLGLFLKGFLGARRSYTSPVAGERDALPPGLTSSLQKLPAVVPTIDGRRHRQALRAVVQRVLALNAATPAGERDDVDAELAHAVDVALVASARVDALDRSLAAANLREASPEVRAQLLERDTWAARLLDLTATLDALDVRMRSATQRAAAGARDELLDELRARVEALEDVQETTR